MGEGTVRRFVEAVGGPVALYVDEASLRNHALSGLIAPDLATTLARVIPSLLSTCRASTHRVLPGIRVRIPSSTDRYWCNKR
ncbi:MAG: hypothetical protein IMX06_10635 [Kyrpidia tusciae]|nr:hypothetical protein [Kyrpidia tusciae]